MIEPIIIDETADDKLKPGVFDFYIKFIKLYNVSVASSHLPQDVFNQTDFKDLGSVLAAVKTIGAADRENTEELDTAIVEASTALMAVPDLNHAGVLLEICEAITEMMFKRPHLPSSESLLAVFFAQSKVWNAVIEFEKFCIVNHPPGEECGNTST